MKIITAALVLIASAGTAGAQVMSYMYEGTPAFSLEYPPGWEIRTAPDPAKPVISASPGDGGMLWQGVWIVRDATTVDAAIARLRAMEEQMFSGVEFPNDPRVETHGDVAVHCNEGSGSFQDHPIGISICLFPLAGDRVGAFVYMGDPGDIETHSADLQSMLASLEVMP